MLDTVKDAFEMMQEEQVESGLDDTEIDGMTGFIFVTVMVMFLIHSV